MVRRGMRANALGHASSRYSVVGLLAMSAPKSGTFCRKHLSVGSASRFEPRTARIGADRFQLLCTVCDLPRAATGPLAAKKSPDATNMWGSASVALGLIVSATPGALNKVPRPRPLDPQKNLRQLWIDDTFSKSTDDAFLRLEFPVVNQPFPI